VLDTIARTLDYPGFTQFPHDEKQYEVEQLLRRQQVLLIIDNAETITDGALFTWLLRLPEPSKAIITTREYQRAYRRGGWPVELRGMSDDEARMMLNQRLERLRIAHLVHDQTQLEPLLAATGGNPKAITMTLGLLKYERRPLQQIVDDLYEARGDLFDDLFSRAWALLDEAARRLLMIATFFVDSASSEALSATADVTGFDFDRAMERLTDLSLLDVQQADLNSKPRYVLHSLVRAFAGAQLAEQAEFEKAARGRWVGWYIDLDAQVGYCWHDISRLDVLDKEEETAFAVINWAFQNKRYTDITQIARGEGIRHYHYVRGNWMQLTIIDTICTQAAKHLGDETTEAMCLENQIIIKSKQGNLSAIPDLFERLRELIQTNNSSTEPLLRLRMHYAEAEFLSARQCFESAQQYWRQAIELAEQISVPFYISFRFWYGICLYRINKSAEAKQVLDCALNDAEQYGYESALVGIPNSLAEIHLDSMELDSAEVLLATSYIKARQLREWRYVAPIQKTYARLHILRGDLSSAQDALTEAIDIFERQGRRRELAEARAELARLEAQMVEAAE
jgi:tetratricopeptide (TPR) repeat protein